MIVLQVIGLIGLFLLAMLIRGEVKHQLRKLNKKEDK